MMKQLAIIMLLLGAMHGAGFGQAQVGTVQRTSAVIGAPVEEAPGGNTPQSKISTTAGEIGEAVYQAESKDSDPLGAAQKTSLPVILPKTKSVEPDDDQN